MTVTFDRRKGTLAFNAGDPFVTGVWSGHNGAANDVSRERERGIGPLPAGLYRIGAPRESTRLGPFVMDLEQIEGESYERSLFRIHGDTRNDHDHSASDGCVIAPRWVREKIDRDCGNPRLLRVL